MNSPTSDEFPIAASSEWAAFILRMALGVMFVSHALLKYLVFTLAGAMQFFSAAGFPPWLAPVTIVAELIGGSMLILGIRSRWASAALLPVLLGATWAHWPNGWDFAAPHGGWEFPAFLVAAAVVQLLLGDGVLALRPDRLLGRSASHSYSRVP